MSRINKRFSNMITKPLSIKDFRKTIKYLNSKNYEKAFNQNIYIKAKGEILIGEAYKRKILTIDEYASCLLSINMNGFLLVPSTFKKLNELDRLSNELEKWKCFKLV